MKNLFWKSNADMSLACTDLQKDTSVLIASLACSQNVLLLLVERWKELQALETCVIEKQFL